MRPVISLMACLITGMTDARLSVGHLRQHMCYPLDGAEARSHDILGTAYSTKASCATNASVRRLVTNR